MAVINVQVNSKVLSLVTSMENDVSKAICEALDLWLKEKNNHLPDNKQTLRKHEPTMQ
jgi:hypothetical protein